MCVGLRCCFVLLSLTGAHRYERWLWAVECVKVRGQAPSEIQAVSFSVSASHSSLDCVPYLSHRLHVPRGRPPSDGVKRLTLVPRENVGHDEKERKMQRKRERALESLSTFVVNPLCPCALDDCVSPADTIHDAEAARARMMDPYSHMTRERELHRDAYSNYVVPGTCACKCSFVVRHSSFRRHACTLSLSQLLQQ